MCTLSALPECDRTKVKGLTPLELNESHFPALREVSQVDGGRLHRQGDGEQHGPEPHRAETEHYKAPPQLRGLGCGAGAGASPVRTSRSRRMRATADDREPMSEVVSSRY